MFDKFKSSQISQDQQMWIKGGDKSNPDKAGGNDSFKGTCPEVCAEPKDHSKELPLQSCRCFRMFPVFFGG